MSTFEEILSAALALPPGTRAMLADHLLESLNGEDQKRIDALWAEEAERRINFLHACGCDNCCGRPRSHTDRCS